MSNEEIIQKIDSLSFMAADSLNTSRQYKARDGAMSQSLYHEGRSSGLNTAAAILARQLGIASMIWDKPARTSGYPESRFGGNVDINYGISNHPLAA